ATRTAGDGPDLRRRDEPLSELRGRRRSVAALAVEAVLVLRAPGVVGTPSSERDHPAVVAAVEERRAGPGEAQVGRVVIRQLDDSRFALDGIDPVDEPTERGALEPGGRGEGLARAHAGGSRARARCTASSLSWRWVLTPAVRGTVRQAPSRSSSHASVSSARSIVRISSRRSRIAGAVTGTSAS